MLKLLNEKKTLELTIKDENSIKERLKQFKKVLENREIIEEFNRIVFESIVDKAVVGRIDKDGTVHPYDLTFYFKTGIKDSQDSNNFKDKRKNAKDNDINKLCSYKNDEDKKLCSQSKDNTCGGNCVNGKKIERHFLSQKLSRWRSGYMCFKKRRRDFVLVGCKNEGPVLITYWR